MWLGEVGVTDKVEGAEAFEFMPIRGLSLDELNVLGRQGWLPSSSFSCSMSMDFTGLLVRRVRPVPSVTAPRPAPVEDRSGASALRDGVHKERAVFGGVRGDSHVLAFLDGSLSGWTVVGPEVGPEHRHTRSISPAVVRGIPIEVTTSPTPYGDPFITMLDELSEAHREARTEGDSCGPDVVHTAQDNAVDDADDAVAGHSERKSLSDQFQRGSPRVPGQEPPTTLYDPDGILAAPTIAVDGTITWPAPTLASHAPDHHVAKQRPIPDEDLRYQVDMTGSFADRIQRINERIDRIQQRFLSHGHSVQDKGRLARLMAVRDELVRKHNAKMHGHMYSGGPSSGSASPPRAPSVSPGPRGVVAGLDGHYEEEPDLFSSFLASMAKTLSRAPSSVVHRERVVPEPAVLLLVAETLVVHLCGAEEEALRHAEFRESADGLREMLRHALDLPFNVDDSTLVRFVSLLARTEPELLTPVSDPSGQE